MKKTILFFGIILFSIVSYGQSENAAINHHTNNEKVSIEHISLISTRHITEEKKILLEKRFKKTFPALRSMSINIETQKVDLTFSTCVSQEKLVRILIYFKSKTYETH